MASSWFPRWQKKSAMSDDGLIAPDETLPLGQMMRRAIFEAKTCDHER